MTRAAGAPGTAGGGFRDRAPAPTLTEAEQAAVDRFGIFAEEERAAIQRVRALADKWDTDKDARYSSARIAKSTAARALREALAGDDPR